MIAMGDVGGRMEYVRANLPSPEEKQTQAQETSLKHHLSMSQKANLCGGKRLLLLFIPPPPSFVNCQMISAFTFPWVNLGLLIVPLPVMKAIERLSQVRHQMADCFAKHKCYQTANSEVPVML